MDSFQTTVASPEALRPARHELATWLGRVGLSAEDVDGVLLAAHEALVVALTHSLAGDPAELSAVCEDDHVRVDIDIADAGTWTPTTEDDSHRALEIIRSSTTWAAVNTEPGQTRVRLIQHLHPAKTISRPRTRLRRL